MRRTTVKKLFTKKEVRQLIEACKYTGYCSFDFETNGVPIYNKDFKPTILIKIAWNGKFDLQIFQLYHIYYRGTLIDAMLAKYILNEEKPNDLKSMVRRYLPEASGYEETRGFNRIPWDAKPLDDLCQYGGQDTDYTFRLGIFYEKKLIDLGLYNYYRNFTMTCSRVLQSVEANGLYIDRDFNNFLLEDYKKKIQQALANILNLPKVKRFHLYLIEQRKEAYVNKIQQEIDAFKEEDEEKDWRDESGNPF